MRRRIIGISRQVLFALNVLILFFLVFEQYLELPTWLHVVGRMHPMFLHFPIVILLLAVALDFFLPPDKDGYRKILLDVLFMVGAMTASITVIMGLFLSLEEQVTPSMQVHKWAGVSIAALAYIVVLLREAKRERPIVVRASYLGVVLSVVVAGHLGSVLTHGEDFLWEPLLPMSEPVMVAREEAVVFDHVIRPVLEARCMGCHNESKAKGELIMLDSAHFAKGGKNGPVFVPGDVRESEMIRRMNLPMEHKKHMPPKGKPQLTEEERQLLTAWIAAGAPFSARLIGLDPSDTLRQIAEARFDQAEGKPQPVFRFTAARDEDIRSLQTDYRVIYPIAYQSPALAVNFYNRHVFSRESLAELKKIGRQIVSLNLSKMPVTDADLELIAGFENLEELNLNFTEVTGSGLRHLASLPSLREISLSGTKTDATALEQLKSLPSLQSVFLWQTQVSEAEVASLRKSLPHVTFDTGFKDDGTMLRLNMPRFADGPSVFKESMQLVLSHPIKNTIIRYTTDGTVPDSLHGLAYEGPVKIDGPVTLVQARAYKEGWIGSEVISRRFLRTSFVPDSVTLASAPAPEYRTVTPRLLVDGETNNLDFRSGSWIGYRENEAAFVLYFDTAVTTRSLTLSMLKSTPSYIFPPVRVEVWGGADEESMTLLGTWNPKQPKKGEDGTEIGLFECVYEPKTINRLKVVAYPLERLPSWHPGKGERGWVFIDEILVN
jgi:uncharacterized membrane protein/mono/diheme cytochrome c family protein